MLLQLLWQLPDCKHTNSRPAVAEPMGGSKLLYGGSGLLLVLGIVLLVLGYALVGVICIVLALVSGGLGFRRGRSAA